MNRKYSVSLEPLEDILTNGTQGVIVNCKIRLELQLLSTSP